MYYTLGVVTFSPISATLFRVKTILLCGNSIPLAGLAASLSRQPGLTVIQADLADLAAPPAPDDMVIVDASQTDAALARLRPHPAWRLLSVDAATGRLTAYAAQSHLVQEVAEIARYLIEDAGGQVAWQAKP